MKFFDRQSDNPRTYVIAEIGNNHNGSMETAKKLVLGAKRAGADCVKFQMRDVETLYRSASLENGAEDLGSEYVFSLLRRFDFSFEQHEEIKDFCHTQQIDYLCTPWDEVSVDRLLGLDVCAFKVASADLTNFPLLTKLASTNLPLILSTGMSSHDEIVSAVSLLKSHNSDFAILHCNSTYPAPFSDINLKYITELQKLHSVVGYSGHERGFAPSLGALTLGAQIIERHITFDRTLEGPDHAASLTVDEFSHFVTACRHLEDALGLGQIGGDLRIFSQGEKINRDNLGKSLVAARQLQKGHIIKSDDVLVRAPGQGLSPNRINELLGKILDRTIEKEDFFFESDLSDGPTEKREFQFSRPWGVPVRYHDFLKFQEMTNANKWEFHLSFNDMEKIPRTFIPANNDEDFVVHAPELFSGSHLLDLVAEDGDYRRRSIDEMKRVVEITQELNLLFPNSTRPLIVANVGGFTMDEPMQAGEKPAFYERLGESLAEFETKEVEVIPQTMAPFPWHFGGQRYQNLFVEPDEILFWARQLNLRVCLDVSHTFLASNHHNFDYYKFVENCGSLIAHIHMGDGTGVNGEGLQLGEGEIDIPRLVGLLNKYSSDSSFIPEIWQGHKDNGVGFWKALVMLEAMGL